MLPRERYLDVWNGLRGSIANFTIAQVLQAVWQMALPLSSATALAQVNRHLPSDRRGRRAAGVLQTASP